MRRRKKIIDKKNILRLRFQNLQYSYKNLNEIILITSKITSNKVIINSKVTSD
jgi:hypothetical protein